MARKRVRDAVIEAINARLGDGSAFSVRAALTTMAVEAIPTGIEVIDRHVIGCGGLPVGRLTEVFSEEGAGKTSFALACMGSAQKSGHRAVLIETEHSFDPSRAEAFGVNVDDLVIAQPESIEDVVVSIGAVIASAPGSLIVWDSIAATPTAREVREGLAGDARIGERGRVLSDAMRKLTKMVADSGCVLLFINQVRDNIGALFGPKHTTPGGHAVKFTASVRIQLYSGKADKDGATHVGKDVTFLALKNKLAPPFRKAKVRLHYTAGWDSEWATLNHAKEMGLVDARGRDVEYARQILGWVSPVPSTSTG